MNPVKLLELMKSRRSIRSYKSEPVPDFMIDQILEAARWCQSGSNLQPWRFIVIKNRDLIENLSNTTSYGRFIVEAPIVITIVTNKIIAPKWYIHDGSMASHQMCLYISVLGLGTCWIGTMDREKAGEMLKLDENEHLITILPIGFPTKMPNPTPRKKMEDLISYIN